MKTLRTILFVAVADALLVLAALLLVAGYQWQAAAVGVGTLAAVALVAWLCRSKPEPVPAPVREWLIVDEPLPADLSETEKQMLLHGAGAVDIHAHRAYSRGEPGWPELPLLHPRRPGAHRRWPQTPPLS